MINGLPNPKYPRLYAAPSLAFEDRFPIDGDFHDVTDYDAAAIQSAVPANAKVMSIDRCRGNEARPSFGPLVDPVFPPRGLPLTQVLRGHGDRAGDAADCQIPGYFVIIRSRYLYPRAAKCDLRKSRDVEKVWTTKMVVPCDFTCPDRAGVD